MRGSERISWVLTYMKTLSTLVFSAPSLIGIAYLIGTALIVLNWTFWWPGGAAILVGYILWFVIAISLLRWHRRKVLWLLPIVPFLVIPLLDRIVSWGEIVLQR